MNNRKVKVLLSVLLVCCVFLPSFSSLSSAVEINASAFSSVNTEVVSMYYLGDGGVIEERYSRVYGDLISSLPSTFTIPYDYNDADRKATFITLDLTFTDDKKFYNTDYRLQFNTSASCYVYSYIFNLPDTYENGLITSDIILSQTALAFNVAYTGRDVGDIYRYPVTMNNDIVSYFNSQFGSNFMDNITTGHGTSDSGTKFISEFHIPQNQTMLYYPKLNISGELQDATPSPRTIRICLYLYQSSGTQTSLEISDLTLIPINGTEQYYDLEVFQNTLIGSDEEGKESGLKGILAFIKSMPDKFFDFFDRLSDQWLRSEELGYDNFFTAMYRTIIELPIAIIEGFKMGLVPSEGYFSALFDSIDIFLSDHLGFLYQFLTVIEDFISYYYDALSNLNDKVNSYLYFPAATIYVSADPPDGQSFIMSNISTDYGTDIAADLSNYSSFNLIPDNSTGDDPEGYYFRFSFLDNEPYSFIYDLYYVATYAIVTVIFITYWYNRARRIFGVN